MVYERTYQQAVQLNSSALDKVDRNIVLTPDYDRTQIGQAWVHIGLGAFSRAHQAVYQDDLFQKFGPTEWGICGLSMLPSDKFLKSVLEAQDNLYSLLVRSPDFDVARVIGSVQRFILASENMNKAISKLASEETKIVSFTITESGYAVNQDNYDLDTTISTIKHDLENPKALPQSTYGLLAAALKRRQEVGLLPFTMMSCDNIQHNGGVLRKMFLKFLFLKDKDLYEWVKENAAFPSTMVDRITPVFSKEVQSTLNNEYGLYDQWPVTCEPFFQWVVEDNFPLGRPEWEKVGVQMVPTVIAYEKLKISCLNVSMIQNSFYGKICGLSFMYEALEEEAILQIIRRQFKYEIGPLLDPIPDIDVNYYMELCIQRNQNKAIGDTVKRMSDDASGKLTKMLFPTLTEAVRRNDVNGFKYLTFIVALFCRLFHNEDQNGKEMIVMDPCRDELCQATLDGENSPDHILAIKTIFPPVLRNNADFVGLLREYVECIAQYGATAALEKVLSKHANDEV